MSTRFYEYQHVVSFEDTNFLGNVYYTKHIGWQGRCRELFLRDHAPELLVQLSQDLRLVTTRCSCEYLVELSALDRVIIRMRLRCLKQNQVSMGFEYWRRIGDREEEELVARGEQEIVSMRQEGVRLVPVPIPGSLREALQAYVG